VIIGYAQGEELVLNTNHYYTSVYLLVTRAGDDLAVVDTLADPALKGHRIGVIAGTPPASHLARQGHAAAMKGYRLMVDRRAEDPVGDMLRDLEAGEIDAAVLWGPVAGPLTKNRSELVATPLLKEEGAPRLFFRITMGVRQGEDDWKRQLNSLIRRNQDAIDAVLREAGVPLADDYGTALKPVP
jgi:ABC-type amino acid transport substrate-binding protein